MGRRLDRAASRENEGGLVSLTSSRKSLPTGSLPRKGRVGSFFSLSLVGGENNREYTILGEPSLTSLIMAMRRLACLSSGSQYRRGVSVASRRPSAPALYFARPPWSVS